MRHKANFAAKASRQNAHSEPKKQADTSDTVCSRVTAESVVCVLGQAEIYEEGLEIV
jgi:hypothetical protein